MNLYRYAQATEQSGIRFYREMAEQAAQEGTRGVFSMLVTDEENLLRKLEGFRRHYPEMSRMECESLQKDGIVFEELRNKAWQSNISSDLEAYRVAIEAEGEVVDQYLRAAAAESDPQIKKMLRWLAAFERHELNEIEKLYDFANAPNCSLEWGEFSNLDEFHNFGYYEDLRRGDLET
jgi:rubrerythrin